MADTVAVEFQFIADLGGDQTYLPGLGFIDDGKGATKQYGAVFDFVPIGIDAGDHHIIESFIVRLNLLVFPTGTGKPFDGGAVFQDVIEFFGFESDVVPPGGMAIAAMAWPIGNDINFVGPEGLKFIEDLGFESGQGGDDGGDGGDADHDTDRGKDRAGFVGPYLSECQSDALGDKSEKGQRYAEDHSQFSPPLSLEVSEEIFPSCMVIIRLACRAMDSSWVTMIMVCPSS